MGKDLLSILIITFVTVVGWIAFEIYHSATESQIPSEYRNIKPIEDELDIDILDEIDTKQQYQLYKPFETLTLGE